MEGGRLPDAELVREALEGDRDDLSTLMGRYQGLVYATILEVLSGQEDVQDLVQETFWRACSNLSRLEDPRRFGAWIRQIARNQAYGYLRRREVRRRYTDLPIPGPVPSPHEVLERREMGDRVGSAIGLLPPEQRQVVLLSYMESKTQQQIAWSLGVSLPTVKARLGRARESLRRMLSPRGRMGVLARRAGEGRHARWSQRSGATTMS